MNDSTTDVKLLSFFEMHKIKGFLADDEGLALYRAAKDLNALGPCLEIGSYCGKSTVYIGKACKEYGNTLYAVDHHQGSEEHQRGQAYHDPELYNASLECMDSFPTFRRTIRLAQLEETVIPLVTSSSIAVKHWATPLSLVFIDGGHTPETSMRDCQTWSKKLASGGMIAVHDLFESPDEGGQGPFLAFQSLMNTGNFEFVEIVNTLGFLRRR